MSAEFLLLSSVSSFLLPFLVQPTRTQLTAMTGHISHLIWTSFTLNFNSDIFWPCLQMWSTACNLWLPFCSSPTSFGKSKGFHYFLLHLFLRSPLVIGAGNVFLPCHVPIISGHHLRAFLCTSFFGCDVVNFRFVNMKMMYSLADDLIYSAFQLIWWWKGRRLHLFSNTDNMHVSVWVCVVFALPWSWIYRLDLSLIQSITYLTPVTVFSQFLWEWNYTKLLLSFLSKSNPQSGLCKPWWTF